jgi:hypothetical protein
MRKYRKKSVVIEAMEWIGFDQRDANNFCIANEMPTQCCQLVD